MLFAKIGPVFLLILIAFLLVVPKARAAEEITTFESHITVNRDTSIKIEETIYYTTDEDKHGIFRYIPFRYHRSGINYTARVSDIAVENGEGQSIPYEQSTKDGNVVLKIGDPDQTFTGAQTYVIRYQVENALQQPEGLPELYWDITGEGWTIPISSTTAVVDSETNITAITCYAGEFGTDEGGCTSEKINNRQAVFRYSHTVNYGDNMTVAVRLDPVGLTFPTRLQKLLRQLTDNLVLLPLLFPGIIMSVWWWMKGRDWSFTSRNVYNHDSSQPQKRSLTWLWRQPPLVYEPINGLTPGEAGALLDERVDGRDIVAEIIDLARQKYLKIERLEKKKLLGAETDYVFTRLKDAGDLPPHQAYLLKHIFSEKRTVKLSELKGTFYLHMDQLKKLIFSSLHEKELFVAHPQQLRGKALVVAVILDIAAGFWFVQLMEQELWWAIPLYFLPGVMALAAAYFLPAKTARGTNFAMQARGLQQSIRRGSWREKIKEKHLFFEEVLPFAVALGVVDRLTRDMDELKVRPPEYLASGTMRGWSTGSFVGSFTGQASSGLSFNPNSSSSSGSGFSGGSSGGGGGGGGGGSW